MKTGRGGDNVVDLLVGDQVSTGSGRYVRLPGEERVYTADIGLLLSAAFTDWVERDLLKVQTPNIASFIIDRHTVRLDAPQPVHIGEIVNFEKETDGWQAEPMPEQRSISSDEITKLLGHFGWAPHQKYCASV